MNYKKHHDNIITRAKTRSLDGYKEIHHIVPKCMGGNNSIDNLVELTAEEHFVIHQLLVKMFPENTGLVYGLHMLCTSNNEQIRNNKRFGWIRRLHSTTRTGMCHSEETKIKIGNANRGRESQYKGIPRSDETKAKVSASTLGKKKTIPATPESRQQMAEKLRGRKKPPRTAEHAMKIADANRGKTQSTESNKKRSEAMKAYRASLIRGTQYGLFFR